jgi:hypothetical protein
MRAVSLLAPVRPGLAGRHEDVAGGSKRSVAVDRVDSHARPIGEDDVPVLRVDGQVRRVVALGRLPVQQRNAAGRLVDRVRAHLAAVAVGRVEEPLLAVERQEPGIVNGVQRMYQRPGAGRGLDAVDADALAARLALLGGEGSDVGNHGKGASDSLQPSMNAAGR